MNIIKRLRTFTLIALIFANQNVQADKGLVAVMLGAKVYCAEGKDNGGEVDFELAKAPEKLLAKTLRAKRVTAKSLRLFHIIFGGIEKVKINKIKQCVCGLDNKK